MNLVRIIQSDVNQKEKDKYHILMPGYEPRKVVLKILLTGQQRRHRKKEQTFGHSGGRRGWDDLREWH